LQHGGGLASAARAAASPSCAAASENSPSRAREYSAGLPPVFQLENQRVRSADW